MGKPGLFFTIPVYVPKDEMYSALDTLIDECGGKVIRRPEDRRGSTDFYFSFHLHGGVKVTVQAATVQQITTAFGQPVFRPCERPGSWTHVRITFGSFFLHGKGSRKERAYEAARETLWELVS